MNDTDQIEELAAKRAKITDPVERIAFDNDPANGLTAIRIGAMLAKTRNREAALEDAAVDVLEAWEKGALTSLMFEPIRRLREAVNAR